MRARALAIVGLFAAGAAAAATIAAQKPEPAVSAPIKKPLKAKTVSLEERRDALSRAQVWIEPPPIARASTRRRSEASQGDHLHVRDYASSAAPRRSSTARCRAAIACASSTDAAPKCRRRSHPRSLLHALGFGADNMMMVEKVRCHGCPAEPFFTMKTLGYAGAEKLYAKVMDSGRLQGFRVGGGRAQALWPRRSRRKRSRAGPSSSSI